MNERTKGVVQPTFYLSHGGGPWPWLKKEMPFFEGLEHSIQAIPASLPVKPEAILIVSGHWEEIRFSVMASASPPMVYDYGGFPEFTYHIQYSAPGHPALAHRAQQLLNSAGIEATLDFKRGFDHGTYSLLYPMYPQADVPIIQISMRSDYDPGVHLSAGRALAPLRKEGVLIIGSGSSYHDLRLPRDSVEQSRKFNQWLVETLVQAKPDERVDRILRWENAPGARAAHPREDHLIPLMIALGAAQDEQAECIYQELLLNRMECASFRFG